MFCGECGTQNPDTNQFCKNCGKPLRTARQVQAPPPAPAPVYPAAGPLPAPAPPQGYSPAPAPAYVPQAAGAPTAAPAQAGILSSGAFWIGLISVVLAGVSWFYYPYLCGLAAVAAGGFALFRSRTVSMKIAVIGGIGVAVAIVSMLVDFFFYTLFPPAI